MSDLPICPRCLSKADHAPDDKACSDECIMRHHGEITRLQAALREAQAQRTTAEAEFDACYRMQGVELLRQANRADLAEAECAALKERITTIMLVNEQRLDEISSLKSELAMTKNEWIP